ncbi:MAG: AMP-binding protein [Candidatus Eisenbacteria bacterium]|uniref:AMP-binding protein n=1 Tax=Eiseniibacteriota bacterium TaxID=2212470 RepID=A0A956NM07_UNCEI|nr:AMP-binding protein [Candidatus Eisenbacteria bacterium]MCB9463972.1 AMP-binding protein [Candidatus Eisenbacteria bacterium]
MNLCEVLVRHVAERPNAPAIIEPRTGGAGTDGSHTISFRDLDDRSARGAHLLQSLGLVPGDRVLVLQPLSIELYVALLAMFRAGLVVCLIDPSAGRAHLAAGLSRVRPRAFFGSTKANLFRLVNGPLRRLRPAISTGISWPGVAAWTSLSSFEPLGDIVPKDPDDDALITFTSGSTGVPKAASRSHGFLLAQHAALERAIELEPGEVDLATLPVFVLANLASGVTTLLPDADIRRPGEIDPESVLRQIETARPTRAAASPAFFERLLSNETGTPRQQEPLSTKLASLRKVYTGGAPVFPRLLARLQDAMPDARICAVYGSTEAEPIAHIHWDEITGGDLERMDSGGGLLTGAPVSEITLRIVEFPSGTVSSIPHFPQAGFDELEFGPGEPGEIVVSGDHVIPSYLDGEGDEETKVDVDGRRWHRTGDTGYLDDTGRLWLLGRSSAVIEDVRGRLYPFAVECAVSRFGWIRRSALVSDGEERVLIVEPIDSGHEGDLDAVLQSLEWALIDRILTVRSIPVDRRHNSKVDYAKLRGMIRDL